MSASKIYKEEPPDYLSTEDLIQTQITELPKPILQQLESEQVAKRFFPDGRRPPVQTAFNHYINRIFLWDTELVAEVMAKLGSKEIVDWAAYSLIVLTDKQRPDGFISNMQYLDKEPGFHIWKVEQSTFKDKNGSDYTQPALLPTAIEAVFEAYLKHGEEEAAWKFLDDIYPRAKLHLEYFKNNRASSAENPLAFNIHPHEDGRDSSGSGKWKMRRFEEGSAVGKAADLADTFQDVVGTFLLKNVRLRLVGWDLDKSRKIYGRRDVMFNSILSKNAYTMSKLSHLMASKNPSFSDIYENDSEMFERYGSQLEQAIYSHMWFEDAVWSPKTRTHKGTFYSLKGGGEREKYIDLGDLMPIILPNLRAEHLVSTLNLILTSFNTNFGLPSAPKEAPYYDPHNKRKTGCNWSGSTWPHMNKLIADGLRLQSERIDTDSKFRDQFDSEIELDQTQYLCKIVADGLARICKELTKEVYAEQYDPETGQPQRYPNVKNFGMAMQADILPHYNLIEN